MAWADDGSGFQVCILALAGLAAFVLYLWPLLRWRSAQEKRRKEAVTLQQARLAKFGPGAAKPQRRHVPRPTLCSSPVQKAETGHPASEEGPSDAKGDEVPQEVERPVHEDLHEEIRSNAESCPPSGEEGGLGSFGSENQRVSEEDPEPAAAEELPETELAQRELPQEGPYQEARESDGDAEQMWRPEEALTLGMQASAPSRRRSLTQALDAAASEQAEESPEEVVDELITHLEESLVQVDLSQRHAVLLRRAELHALTLLGAGRDFLLRSLRGGAKRRRLERLFGGDCARISRLRAVLESMQLSAGRVGDARLKGCRDACDAVESVLRDLGLQETLCAAQQQKRTVLQATIEQKRLEEEKLLQQRRERSQQLKRLAEEERKALERAMQSQSEADAAPAQPVVARALSLKPDFAIRDASMLNWFLDYAEALLCDVLCFLDGPSLAKLEAAGRWPKRLGSTSLPGIWRFVHLCSLGGRPPRALARAPQPPGRGRSGAWKQYWLGRQLLFREPDGAQRQIAFEQARMLLSAHADAVVQPMKPSARLLRRVIDQCLPLGFSQDPRFGPLLERWCTHLMVGGDSMVTHANGVQTNHEQFFMSWSVCFSAAQGLPRLFLASARRFSEHDAWEVDLADCRLPARAPLAWAAAAQEIHELRAAGRDVGAGLCGARELCSARFQGLEWRAQSAQLAPAADWALLHKDLFGGPVEGSSPTICLRLLLALTCPNPFAQEPAKLELALTSLQPLLHPEAGNPE